MKSSKSRRVLQATLAGLALFLVACSRQPAAERDAGSSASPTTVGTSGEIAQAAAPSGTAAAPTAASTTPETTVERDPDAIKALEKMGNYLRTLKAFQVRTETSRDEVLDDGQNVEFDGVVDMIVARPNRLRVEVTSDKQQRLYFYNGSNLSVWAQRVNYYATVPAPPTIRELVDTLTSKYDIELPLADLFYWSDQQEHRRHHERHVISETPRSAASRASTTPSVRKARTGRSGFSWASIRCRASS